MPLSFSQLRVFYPNGLIGPDLFKHAASEDQADAIFIHTKTPPDFSTLTAKGRIHIIFVDSGTVEPSKNNPYRVLSISASPADIQSALASAATVLIKLKQLEEYARKVSYWLHTHNVLSPGDLLDRFGVKQYSSNLKPSSVYVHPELDTDTINALAGLFPNLTKLANEWTDVSFGTRVSARNPRAKVHVVLDSNPIPGKLDGADIDANDTVFVHLSNPSHIAEAVNKAFNCYNIHKRNRLINSNTSGNLIDGMTNDLTALGITNTTVQNAFVSD